MRSGHLIIGLPLLIRKLLKPDACADRPCSIRLIQTHISYVLLTPRFVYKIKKPVNFGFLDFSSLQKRLYYCKEEVRLNQRLSRDIYLGVVPVTRENGQYRLEAKGAPIEYAVKMRHINDQSLLSCKIEDGSIDEGAIRRVARRIAQFHKGAITDRCIEKFGTPAAVFRNTQENFSQTLPYIGRTISKERYDSLRAYTQNFLTTRRIDLIKRVKAGFIKDCHGDLHADHVAINANGRIDIIDCIEFSERYRCSDTALDAAFLSMDLDFKGRPDLSKVFDEEYFRQTRDRAAKGLLYFYKCYRAIVRAKVASFKYAEPEVPPAERTCAYIDAMRHFHLATQYTAGCLRPRLIVMRGLSGSGKTTLAKSIAEAFDMHLLSSDVVRKTLAGIKPSQHAYADLRGGIYAPSFTRRTYKTLNLIAQELLKKGVPVVLDAAFPYRSDLQIAQKTAKAAGADFHIVHCIASERAIKERIFKRTNEPTNVSDALFNVYLAQKRLFEPSGLRTIKLDTESDSTENLKKAARSIFYKAPL